MARNCVLVFQTRRFQELTQRSKNAADKVGIPVPEPQSTPLVQITEVHTDQLAGSPGASLKQITFSVCPPLTSRSRYEASRAAVRKSVTPRPAACSKDVVALRTVGLHR